MTTNKQKQQLKKIAHSSDILKINIGKEVLDKDVIKNIDNSFNTRELIKISFLKSALDNCDKNTLIIDLTSHLKCEVVQTIGNTMLIYRPNDKLKDHIILEK